MATKAILVDAQALDAKYGERAEDIWRAIDDLIAADRDHGVESELVKLDDPSGPAGTAAIAPGADWRAAKGAVDAVAQASTPDYLMLLGGPDLLPHCQLDNPTSDDEDPVVPSDLPYACDAPASTEAADFTAPTRVVSRLPDVPGATDPDVLLALLATATGWKSRERESYETNLGVTAQVWEGSTRLTLTQIYGAADEMKVSPPDGPAWSAALLDRLSHFANLHGAPRSSKYYGQQGMEYPVGLDAALVEGNVEEGTVAAAEACYGAELFEANGQLAMPFAYLGSGAYGFFGSTTIAWGPVASNDWADVLCRLFQASILQGASIGRAGLEARQEYIAQSAPLDPIDLKTLAQFLVLGDPSVQPVITPAQAVAPPAEGAAPHGLPARRRFLRSRGEGLREVTAWAQPVETPGEERILGALREVAGVPSGEPKVSSFALRDAPQAHGMLAFAGEGPDEPATMHLLVQDVELEKAPMDRQLVAVVAVEEGGQLISVKTAATR